MSVQSSPKRNSGQFRYIRQALRLRIPLSIATMVFAALGLITNIANVDLFMRPLGDGATTHPITAFGLLLVGYCIFTIRRFEKTGPVRKVLVLLLLVTCVARLGIGAFGLKIDFTAYTPDFVHGRFSIESAIALGCFSLAGLLRRARGHLGIVFLVVALATVYNSVIELSYGLTFFQGDVGPFSLFGFVSAALAMVTVYLHRPFVRVFFLAGEIGYQTRTMAFTAMALPYACGIYIYHGTGPGSYDDPLFAVMLAGITWATLVILMNTSARHEMSDAARRQGERTIDMLSKTDSLTGTLNRLGMGEALSRAWKLFELKYKEYGVILVDLDHFKKINDTYGHDAGDDVLGQINAVLRPHLRVSDALGRWGGEEFLILLEIQNRSDLEGIAERLRKALANIESPLITAEENGAQQVSASLGVSAMRIEDSSASDAIRRADIALYEAKERGRNCVVPNYLTLVA